MKSRVLRVVGLAALFACATSANAQSSVADGRRNDLAVFRSTFFLLDSSYAPDRRAEATTRLSKLESEVSTISAAYFELELARIVALADNGHTHSPAAFRSRHFARVPVRFVPFGDQFYILRADTAHADLLGARLLAIGGKSLRDVRTVAHTLVGGTAAFRDRSVPFFMESPDQMQALGVTTNAQAATYRLELRNGRTVERRIVGASPDEQREVWRTSRWLSPDPLDTDGGAWRHVLASDRVPWAFQEVARTFRIRNAPELNAVVVQLRSNVDAPGAPIGEFLRTALDEIRRVKPANIILDMRTNGGGDLNNTRDFAQALPALAPGRVFVLTSPWTFSAAISTVGYLKQAGGNRVTIVGEMVGDRLEFWAEGRFVRLPYSSAGMSYSTQRHDYKTGCRPYKDCHGAVVRHPISVNSLAPDIEAPLTFDAFIAGNDPGMDAIARVVRTGDKNSR